MMSKPWLCTTCVKRRKCLKHFVVRILGIARYVHSTNCYEPEWKPTYRKIDNAKSVGNETNKIETSDMPDLKIGIDISVRAVNEYAKSILKRYPKDNMEFSRALELKILEETKSLANSKNNDC